jgi:hypothetical protein
MTVRSNSSQRKMDRAKTSLCVAFGMMPYIEHVQAALRTAMPSGDDMHVSVPFEAPVSVQRGTFPAPPEFAVSGDLSLLAPQTTSYTVLQAKITAALRFVMTCN